jgi:hypothetical protein
MAHADKSRNWTYSLHLPYALKRLTSKLTLFYEFNVPFFPKVYAVYTAR